ncbi:MAG: hdfR 3 [Holophagaceae bacterium]|nr:hdfR 3 [Holophagaceae bacterium]
MDIKQLHCFTTVAKHLNFSEAAKHLAITQSTVSYQIAELERQLDMKLFVRDKHSVKLTTSGTIFAQEVTRILADLNEAVNKAWMAKSGAAGNLQIAFLSSMERVLGDVVKRFAVTHPNINLALNHPSMQALHDGLKDGSVDAGVTFSIGIEPGDPLNYQRLSCEDTAVIMPLDHPLATREHLCLADLKGVPIVAMTRESGFAASDWAMERFAKRGFIPNIVRRTSDLGTLLFMVESGLGVAVLTRQTVEYYSNLKLLARKLEDEDLAVEVMLAWSKHSTNPCLPLFLREFGVRGL